MKNSKFCKNKDSDFCILWSACKDCYYYEEDLICYNCGRIIPYSGFLNKKGCKWCVPKNITKYCTGEY